MCQQAIATAAKRMMKTEKIDNVADKRTQDQGSLQMDEARMSIVNHPAPSRQLFQLKRRMCLSRKA
jgi:hypothetical protein